MQRDTSSRARWLALYVLCLGDLMIVLDQSIVNVALPSIRDDLGFSQSSLAWVVNAYLLTFGGFLLLSGRLGDLLGNKRVFLGGTVFFIVASVACGLAPSSGLLIVGRAVQGLGGAAVSAVALSLIMGLFTEGAERAKAMGVFGFVMSGGGAVGVLLGGVLTGLFSWHWIFLVNVPIGLAVLFAARTLLPADDVEPGSAKLDVPGAVLVTGALMLAVYGIVGGNEHGWTSGRTLGFLGVERRAVRDLRRSGSPVPPRRWCRSASSGSATWSSRRSSASSGPPRCSPGSSSPPSTCRTSWATRRSRSAWPSSRPAW